MAHTEETSERTNGWKRLALRQIDSVLGNTLLGGNKPGRFVSKIP